MIWNVIKLSFWRWHYKYLLSYFAQKSQQIDERICKFSFLFLNRKKIACDTMSMLTKKLRNYSLDIIELSQWGAYYKHICFSILLTTGIFVQWIFKFEKNVWDDSLLLRNKKLQKTFGMSWSFSTDVSMTKIFRETYFACEEEKK